MSKIIEIDGRNFTLASENPIANWACELGDRPLTTLTLKDNELFLITDTLGNIYDTGCSTDGIEGSMGLFCRDTRFLSRAELQIEGRSPILFSSTARKGFDMVVLCSNRQIGENEDVIKTETIGIHREIMIKGGLFEHMQVTNYNTHPISFTMSLSFGADFLDLFEVRGAKRAKRGDLLICVPDLGKNSFCRNTDLDTDLDINTKRQIVLAYRGLDGVLMESRIQFHAVQPDEIKGYTAIWNLTLDSHQSVMLGYRIHLFTNNRPTSMVSVPTNFAHAKSEESLEEVIWTEKITTIRTDNQGLNLAINRAVQDIYLLQQTFEGHQVLSAGVPWFSTLFGRDSIISASQTLVLNPAIARETLLILAQYQGKTEDNSRDEERGKILHEIRVGEMARCQEIPHTPYYGTVDATPLWLMLYAEYYAWTDDTELLNKLWSNAIAAMEWIDRSCKDTGYLTYNRRSKKGLVNQGWKDSDNCIVNRHGELAQGAIALSEVQGYVYAAKIRMSELADKKNLPDFAKLWRSQAQDLKTRFNQDFWLADQDYCALALDGDGKPVDSITSNPGHCLHLGIFDREKALMVAARLKQPDMYNGWGIRTLSSLSPAYNPLGYHIGSVWPHDNSLIALGLRSLNLVNQSLDVAQGLFNMTLAQPYHRPPELFCGYEYDGFNSPIQYPVACSPQAWATGTIFQLISMMANLTPNAPAEKLYIIDPALPPSIHQLSIHNLRIGKAILDLDFERSGTRASDVTTCRVNKKHGNLRVIIEA